MVFSTCVAAVIGPTPPGTGVIHPLGFMVLLEK
jgi:hypothetical protein